MFLTVKSFINNPQKDTALVSRNTKWSLELNHISFWPAIRPKFVWVSFSGFSETNKGTDPAAMALLRLAEIVRYLSLQIRTTCTLSYLLLRLLHAQTTGSSLICDQVIKQNTVLNRSISLITFSLAASLPPLKQTCKVRALLDGSVWTESNLFKSTWLSENRSRLRQMLLRSHMTHFLTFFLLLPSP